jgi:cytochrome bd-type quinol oxidase subunit 2
MRSNLKALAIGLLMYLLIYGLKYGYEEALLRPESMASLKRLFFFGSTIFALMLLVVPSYVSGLFVTDRGNDDRPLCGGSRSQCPIFFWPIP